MKKTVISLLLISLIPVLNAMDPLRLAQLQRDIDDAIAKITETKTQSEIIPLIANTKSLIAQLPYEQLQVNYTLRLTKSISESREAIQKTAVGILSKALTDKGGNAQQALEDLLTQREELQKKFDGLEGIHKNAMANLIKKYGKASVEEAQKLAGLIKNFLNSVIITLENNAKSLKDDQLAEVQKLTADLKKLLEEKKMSEALLAYFNNLMLMGGQFYTDKVKNDSHSQEDVNYYLLYRIPKK